MQFEQGAAQDGSTRPNPAVKSRKPQERDLNFWIALVIGILIGMLLAVVLASVLYAFGYINFGLASSPPATTSICPPTAAYLPACPTCAVTSCTVEATSTSTPTPPAAVTLGLPTDTPDYAATATQACAVFRSRFPGTPCPRFRTPTPGP